MANELSGWLRGMRVGRPIALIVVLLPLLLWIKFHPALKLVASSSAEGKVINIAEKTLTIELPDGRRAKVWKPQRHAAKGEWVSVRIDKFEDGSEVVHLASQP